MTSLYTYRGTNDISNQSEILNLKSEMDCTRWLYDNPTGLLTNKLYADGLGPIYTYTPDHKLFIRTWVRGITTTYTYAPFSGELTSVDYSDDTPDVMYTFNRIGLTLSANNTVSTNLFAYSPQTLDLVSETQNGAVISHLTDMHGRSSGVSVGEDYKAFYNYSTLGRFASVAFSVCSLDTKYAQYTYLSGSDLIYGYTSGVLTNTRSYENLRDLIMRVRNETPSPVGVVSQYEYSNDAIGRRSIRIDSGLEFAFPQIQTNLFFYNQNSEIICSIMHTNSYGYNFDPIGNRRSSYCNAETNAYIVNNLNQYTNITSQVYHLQSNSLSPLYDTDGNMIFSDKGWSYSWNGENRLILASNATHIVRYAYDYRGRNVRKCISLQGDPAENSQQSFLWDDHNIIADTRNYTLLGYPERKTRYYVWGLDLSGTLQGAGGVGGLLAVYGNGLPFLPLYDANGNITEYIASPNIVLSHRDYSPFGETSMLIQGDDSGLPIFGWSTKPICRITGMIEYEFRHYLPDRGMWTSRDSLCEVGGLNLYAHTCNAPVNRVDYLGWVGCPCDEKAALFLAASLTVSAARLSKANPVYDNEEDKKKKRNPYYLEYCGRICCDKATSTPYQKGPVAGHFRHGEDDYNRKPGGTPTCGEAFNTDATIDCNAGDQTMIEVHTHAEDNDKPCFSPGDLGRPKQTCVPLVLKNNSPTSPVVMCCGDGKCYQIAPLTGQKREIPCPKLSK
jgi:RHS repeat-associated protein